ncbi:MAG: Swt1 family HEPN domain-containing protein, partial [Chloroflexota bacterium]
MATSNIERIGNGLQILRVGLAPYILRELKSFYKERWWISGVETVLENAVGREGLLGGGTAEERFSRMDIQALLIIMWENWNNVFKDELGHSGRNYVSELREVRNNWAHQQPFNPEDTFRALDTMTRLLEMASAQGVDELKELGREMLRQRFEAETKRELKKSTAVLSTGVVQGLKSWREITTPHQDVASGRYHMAEFAADLFQVITGKAESEYRDPREFFRRTYLTEGLSRLLSQAWARLSSAGGDPVVELQTNFGGGKTHSMLALYHLFGGEIKAQDVPGLENLVPSRLKGGEVDLPVACRAVLVGTQLSPAEVRTKPDGIQIRTLWGEMAWQIGTAVGKAAEVYALVVEEDRRGISPGSEKLAHIFDQYGPVLVLIDEWVAYTRQLYREDDLPGGSFDANMTFAQAITEAAKAVPDAMVVAAIPQSDIEIGGEKGKAALERIQNVFGRVEAVWKPASATESFEIVRRRLFQPVSDHAARDAVCRAFAEMYQTNRAEFPSECREVDYEKRLVSAYPIHPELFDRLYEDWSTLERFQRTRGVLRMMAAIVHELWERQDGSLLIMPGSVPMDTTDVRFEVTRYLPEGWGAVVDKDIDGSLSRPLALDRDNSNLGRYSACRRVARTIFTGSAPSSGAQHVHGIEEVRIKLGCVQPGESAAVFGDALRRLSEELTYLYSDSTRYWYDTRPTISRIASDRAAQYERKPDTVEDEIIRRVRLGVSRERGDFGGVHVIPSSSADVPDETTCRLVILGPLNAHRKQTEESKALLAAREILEQRGNSPRLYRNMLIFLAADADRLAELEQALRNWLAWTSIKQDAEHLDLSVAQKRQVDKQVQNNEDTINARILETYCHLIVPTQDGTKPFEWSISRLQGGDNLVSRASKKLKSEQQLITDWSPVLLRMELDRWLWKEKNHLGTKQLWEYLAQYLYLSRLKDEEVLVAAIRSGVGSLTWKENFAYASAVGEDGRYLGLQAGSLAQVSLDSRSVLVKPEIAQQQRDEDARSLVDAPPIPDT